MKVLIIYNELNKNNELVFDSKDKAVKSGLIVKSWRPDIRKKGVHTYYPMKRFSTKLAKSNQHKKYLKYINEVRLKENKKELSSMIKDLGLNINLDMVFSFSLIDLFSEKKKLKELKKLVSKFNEYKFEDFDTNINNCFLEFNSHVTDYLELNILSKNASSFLKKLEKDEILLIQEFCNISEFFFPNGVHYKLALILKEKFKDFSLENLDNGVDWIIETYEKREV